MKNGLGIFCDWRYVPFNQIQRIQPNVVTGKDTADGIVDNGGLKIPASWCEGASMR